MLALTAFLAGLPGWLVRIRHTSDYGSLLSG
jgi:hypothetical protein